MTRTANVVSTKLGLRRRHSQDRPSWPDPLRRNYARVHPESRSVSRDRTIMHGGGSESGIGGELRLARTVAGRSAVGYFYERTRAGLAREEE